MESEQTTPAATDEDQPSLDQRLWNVAQATENGRVRGYIDTCGLADDDTIRVRVRLPNAQTHIQTFPVPKADSPEYAFVRLVEDCGYSLASAAQIAGDDETDAAHVWCEPIDTPEHATDPQTDADNEATAVQNNNDWRLLIPEYTPPLRERLRARLDTLNSSQVITPLAVAGGFLLLPLIFPIILFRVAADDEPPDAAMTFFVGLTALLIWSAVMVTLYTVVVAPVG